MKICVVAYKFGTEEEIGRHLGTYHYFIEMTRRLHRQGHDIEVVAPWLSFTKRGSRDVDGVKIHRYFPPLWDSAKWFLLSKPLKQFYIFKTARLVMRLDQESKWDAIVVWQARTTGYAVAKISHLLRAPFLFRQITAWQWHFERKIGEIYGGRSWYRFFARLKLQTLLDPLLEMLLNRRSELKFARTIYKQADRVVFVSQAAAREGLALGLAPQKIAVIGVSIDIEVFKPQENKLALRKELGLPYQKVILFIGRISFAEKGIGDLLDAMPRVLEVIPQAGLVIIGAGGEMPRVTQQIEKLGIKEQVLLVGKKPFFELPKYLNASDVLAVPSVWLEHFGQVTIDAMACAVPVVTSDIGGSAEINLDGTTGYVVPAKDSVKLAEALLKILEDENLAKSLGLKARERVLKNYTYEVLVNKFIELIKDVRR